MTDNRMLSYVSPVELQKTIALKAKYWNSITENTAIPETITVGTETKNLVGIAITSTGTCIALDGQDTPEEMSLTNYPVGFYPAFPAKLKTGLTATVFALYGE